MNVEFSWDDSKAISNQKKHGISFEEAKTVFYDDYARVIHDPDHSIDEDRFIILGMSSFFHILVVVHCYRDSDTNIRIISARKASTIESKHYQGYLP